MARQGSLRRRLLILALLASVLPLIGLGGFASLQSRERLAHVAEDSLATQTALRGARIEAYFESVRNDVLSLAQSSMTARGLREFTQGFALLPAQRVGPDDAQTAPSTGTRGDDAAADARVETELAAARGAVASFVDQVFGARYRELAGSEGPEGEGFAASLSPSGALLQDWLIASNPAALGEKDSLVELPGDTDYGRSHAELHPIYRAHLQRNEYYDIFLIEPEGDLVYSVFKELDYATNLRSGPWRESGLARAFRAAADLAPGDSVAVDDYAPYTPSYESPAMFLASPVWADGQRLGVLVVQISLARISHIVADDTGLDAARDVWVAGPDRLLRSDSRLGGEAATVARHFAQPEASRLAGDALQAALAGKVHDGTGTALDGREALVSARPVEVAPGLVWAIVATHASDAAYAPAERLLWTVALAVLAVAALVALASWQVAGRIVRPVADAQRAAERIAGLQLDNSLVPRGNDEVAALTRALARMQDDLRARIERESQIAAENAAIREGLESASSGVMINDVEGRVRYVNPALARLLRRIEPALRALRSDFDASSPVGQQFDPLTLADDGGAVAASERRDARLQLGERSLELHASPIRDGEGRCVGHVFEWQDRTAESDFRSGLARAAEEAAAGFLDTRLAVDAEDPRFGELARIFNEMLGNTAAALNEVEQVMDALAEGRLDVRSRAALKGRFGELSANANRTADALAEVIAEIQGVVGEIGSAAGEIARGNEDLSRRTEQAAASIEETAAALHQVNSMVGSSAQNAHEARTLAGRAAESASEGGQVVAQVVQTMAAIRESSRRMSDIIAVIDGIAFQTNILALNAAVEAARAGEQGRGFAVVASEVRALAQRSAEAAKEIAALIRDSGQRVEHGSGLVSQAGERMDLIVGSARQVAEIVADIAVGAAEQAKGISEVNSAVDQLDQTTQANAALVEEVAANADALSRQAAHLDAITARFSA